MIQDYNDINVGFIYQETIDDKISYWYCKSEESSTGPDIKIMENLHNSESGSVNQHDTFKLSKIIEIGSLEDYPEYSL